MMSIFKEVFIKNNRSVVFEMKLIHKIYDLICDKNILKLKNNWNEMKIFEKFRKYFYFIWRLFHTIYHSICFIKLMIVIEEMPKYYSNVVHTKYMLLSSKYIGLPHWFIKLSTLGFG